MIVAGLTGSIAMGKSTVAAMFVDRQKLSAYVLNDSAALKRLEGLVHPAVAERRAVFIAKALDSRRPLIFLDVPLLFETGGDRFVDVSIVVSADPARQHMRALARPGMTREKLASLLAKQMPDSEKRRRAHFVIDTNRDMQATRCEVRDLVRSHAAMTGRGTRHA